eukprot:scaffold211592_cov17-Tisochrysis_lutea.AAC.1
MILNLCQVQRCLTGHQRLCHIGTSGVCHYLCAAAKAEACRFGLPTTRCSPSSSDTQHQQCRRVRTEAAMPPTLSVAVEKAGGVKSWNKQ